ncbi:unnamed protein product [Lactuca saligna]|uniref:FHA domain-containing protein n=1 Tax=Lactuca saligna TaxID=75948 RepID=A0AA35UZJ4_LACSI|nr:unnamed protein product [Lactuca saligna]
MEIEGKSGSKIRLEEGSETFDFGRELGFISSDRAISRHHISFKLHEDRTRVYFEVKGKNPVWVRDRRNDEIRVYKRSEGGEIKNGDSFCVASKNPVWFNVKRIASENEDDSESKSELSLDEAFAETSGIEYDEVETGDISHIDPVKEFGFVVVGHEFDRYPMKMLSDISNWDWFLEEPKQESDEEEVNVRKRKKSTRKRRKKSGEDDDDEVWTGESEEDAEIIKKMKNAPKPKYSTRSKEQKQDKKGATFHSTSGIPIPIAVEVSKLGEFATKRGQNFYRRRRFFYPCGLPSFRFFLPEDMTSDFFNEVALD